MKCLSISSHCFTKHNLKMSAQRLVVWVTNVGGLPDSSSSQGTSELYVRQDRAACSLCCSVVSILKIYVVSIICFVVLLIPCMMYFKHLVPELNGWCNMHKTGILTI